MNAYQTIEGKEAWKYHGYDSPEDFTRLYGVAPAREIFAYFEARNWGRPRLPLPSKGPRPPLQVRGEGEGRHPMMM